jgi:hypothetical protein
MHPRHNQHAAEEQVLLITSSTTKRSRDNGPNTANHAGDTLHISTAFCIARANNCSKHIALQEPTNVSTAWGTAFHMEA